MASLKTAWGIDIGQCALKAIKLRQDAEGAVHVDGFEVVEHSNILSQPDADPNLLIQQSLDEFLRRADVTNATISVSVLGQSSFTRFVKLPPVEHKKIPEIVRFEAEQQIPFPIDEVSWRYQTFQDPDSPEVEVGIFAMKQVDVTDMLAYFNRAGLEIDIVQMGPLALYNFMVGDDQIDKTDATMLADVGADKTHLVVADGHGIWTRTIRIGGNNFTEALVKSFKLSFPKAEKLKRSATNSKYARQIFQVMRPVFADMVQEIQRSIGYYTSLHRESRFKLLVGMGNGFRLPGMHKYLEQNLNMPVTRVEKFKRLSSSNPDFQQHVLCFGVAYGLAIQALDRSVVRTNLLPEQIVRSRLWRKKKPWFAFAAAAVVLAAAMFVFRSYGDLGKLKSFELQQNMSKAEKIISRLKGWKRDAREIGRVSEQDEQLIQGNLKLRAHTRIWPALNSNIAHALLRTTTMSIRERQILQMMPRLSADQQVVQAAGLRSDQAKLELIGMLPFKPPEPGKPESLRQKLINELGKKTRNMRNIMILETQIATYKGDITPLTEKTTETTGGPPGGRYRRDRDQVDPAAPVAVRGFEVVLTGRTPLRQAQAVQRLGEFKNLLAVLINEDPDMQVIGRIEEVDPRRGERTTAGATARPRRPVGGLEEFGGRGGPGGISTTDKGKEVVEPDPLFPSESMAGDFFFQLTVRVGIVGSGFGQTKPKAEVQRTFLSSISAKKFRTGPLSNGTAVLVDDQAAYWVKDGTVYAANGVAKTWSPNIKYAPTGIDIDSVKQAVGK
jgi:type IV pilus assembly protein PilM